MPRLASSVSEIAQIERVRALVSRVGVAQSPYVEVVTASGRCHTGQLLRDLVGNTPKLGGWDCYGVITLGTEYGDIEIDYLDIVTVQRLQQIDLETASSIPALQVRRSARRATRTKAPQTPPAE